MQCNPIFDLTRLFDIIFFKIHLNSKLFKGQSNSHVYHGWQLTLRGIQIFTRDSRLILELIERYSNLITKRKKKNVFRE